MDRFYINGIEVQQRWNMVFQADAYNELRKPAKAKEPVSNNWSDEHGTERRIAGRFMESRQLTLNVAIKSTTAADYSARHIDLVSYLLAAGYFTLSVEALNRNFTLLYLDTPGYEAGNNYGLYKLSVVDDFPHLLTPFSI